MSTFQLSADSPSFIPSGYSREEMRQGASQFEDSQPMHHQHAPPVQQQPVPMPPAIVAAGAQPNVHGRCLDGKVEYMPIPKNTGNGDGEVHTVGPWERKHKVFFGQVKFECTPTVLRWLIWSLTGILAGRIEQRGMGCYGVFMNSAEDVFKIVGLNKRVLFDIDGVWFAGDEEQEGYLLKYAETVAPSVDARLPRGLLVVDDESSRKVRGRKKKSAQNEALERAFQESQKRKLSEDLNFMTAAASGQATIPPALAYQPLPLAPGGY